MDTYTLFINGIPVTFSAACSVELLCLVCEAVLLRSQIRQLEVDQAALVVRLSTVYQSLANNGVSYRVYSGVNTAL